MRREDFCAAHMQKLFKYFFHWEEDVRLETYRFLADGLKQLKAADGEDGEEDESVHTGRTIELLLELIARGIVVEKSLRNFTALVELWKLAERHLPRERRAKALGVLFDVAVSAAPCEKIIQKLCGSLSSDEEGVLRVSANYAFFTNSLSSFAHFDNITLRM